MSGSVVASVVVDAKINHTEAPNDVRNRSRRCDPDERAEARAEKRDMAILQSSSSEPAMTADFSSARASRRDLQRRYTVVKTEFE